MYDLPTPESPRRTPTTPPALADLRRIASGQSLRAGLFDSAPKAPAGAAAPHAATAPAVPPHAAFLAAMLDEVDYPMLLLDAQSHVLQANKLARTELAREHPLQLAGETLRARETHDVIPLAEALHDAQVRGLRKLLTLSRGTGQAVTLSVVPLHAAHAHVPPGQPLPVLLILGKRQVCGELLVHWYARSNGLTPAESGVLKRLCEGTQPTEIAKALGVAISTVRSQISSIRAKTGAQSIRDLVHQVAVLPPLVNVLGAAGG
jgi:DNA-binding CsgD family transcriptional regulator